ncbi:hypothetical protein BYT27DRAFT_6894707 [Phlegmacium glaucopus]|nr:hypothetical protein BYT27DRAFT_6894707 [Phlegmacium glaucopus]
MRTALLLIRNPSSAPVQAQVDMANYYTAAERRLTRNYSVDCIQVTQYVDETLNETNETTIVEMNFEPPKQD